MKEARIYKPTKTAMQSGQGNTRRWVLEFEPHEPKKTDPLMGWCGSGDMDTQIRLRFDSKEEAVAYATRKGFAYKVQTPKVRHIRPKNYADNFAFHHR